jgi:hypothetical protein
METGKLRQAGLWFDKSLALPLLLLLAFGCSSESVETAAVPIASDQQSSESSNGLSDAEITDFLMIVRELPGGEFPEFEPAGVPRVQPEQEPESAILAWRTAYRRSCEPAQLAQSWQGERNIAGVLARRGYSPEEFAHLVRRISLSITADSLADRIDFSTAHQHVEEQIAEMTQAIHQLDVAPDVNWTVQDRLHRREAMMLALQETTALSEFLRLLSDIPEESRLVAQRRRTELESFLPDHGREVSQFERFFEMNAEVVPAANWQPQ